ncbi:hypothetical protein AMECASPLE_013074 [Ameca splendens]|uniref:Cyclin-D-binding Myb-like transcription factor 1 N-terminal domain-containing protein n=1 Tax=Ameca splendens TaxID=208324 RepID=A0ABV0ZL04_9TELE
MSSAAEEPAALESVKPVTLTQDSDGSIILHCPSNDEESEPLQKKMRVSTEDNSEAPQFSVVTMSENDDSFEVTMTATAEGDLPEDGVTEIEVDMELPSCRHLEIQDLKRNFHHVSLTFVAVLRGKAQGV